MSSYRAEGLTKSTAWGLLRFTLFEVKDRRKLNYCFKYSAGDTGITGILI